MIHHHELPRQCNDKWATSKSTQLPTKVWVKVLLENALTVYNVSPCKPAPDEAQKAQNFVQY